MSTTSKKEEPEHKFLALHLRKTHFFQENGQNRATATASGPPADPVRRVLGIFLLHPFNYL